MANFTGTNGPPGDNFAGTDNVADTFTFAVADIEPALDDVTGGNGSTEDRLILTTAGTVGTNRLNVFSQIETIELSAAGNSVTLTKAFANSAFDQTVTVIGFGGNDFIDGSALTLNHRLIVASGGGSDSLIGGVGSDEFRFTVAQLTGTDSVAGGNGFSTDTLTFLSGGTITAAKLANVSQIERIQLTDVGTTLTLTDALVTSANGQRLEVASGTGNDVIDGSAVLGANRLFVTSGAGADRVLGGEGDDTFQFTADGLTSADTVTAGAGADTIQFTTAGVIGVNAFANVSGVGALQLSSFGNTVTLNEAFALSGDSINISVAAKGSGNDVVDASAVVSEAVRFDVNAGDDRLLGGGGNDEFNFRTENFNGNDTVDGGGGVDTLKLGDGTYAAGRFAHVSNIDAIVFAGVANVRLTLGAAFQANNPTADGIDIFCGNGSDTVNASGFVPPGVPGVFVGVSIVAGSGDDRLIGGGVSDIFRFQAVNLTSADTVTGGGGLDTLQFDTAGVVAAAAFANVSGIERLINQASNTTLSDSFVTSSDNFGRLTVIGNSGNDVVNGAAVSTAGTIIFVSNGGNDTVAGGAGNDSFESLASQISAADSFNGGLGINNALILTEGGTVTSAQIVNALTNVNILEISADPTGASGGEFSTNLTLDNTVVAAGDTLFVQSDGADIIDTTALSSDRTVFVRAGDGDDKLSGGASTENYSFIVSELTLNDPVGGVAGDIVDGGAGIDTLAFLDSGQIFAAQLGSVTHMEVFQFSSFGNTLALSNRVINNNLNTATNTLTILGGNGSDILITPSQTLAAIDFTAGTGNDLATGGRANDFFRIAANALSTNDFFDGATGVNDTLVVSGGNLNLDGIAQNSLRSIETIVFGEAAGGQTLTIDRNDVEGITASNVNVLGTSFDNVLIVTGSNAGDQVNVELSASGLVAGSIVSSGGKDFQFFTAGTGGANILAVDTDFLA